jgi:hypothetical protein
LRDISRGEVLGDLRIIYHVEGGITKRWGEAAKIFTFWGIGSEDGGLNCRYLKLECGMRTVIGVSCEGEDTLS